MKTPFEKIYAQLQYATPVKARQVLRELERLPEDMANFCRQARRLPPSKASQLCPILSAMNTPEYMELLRDYALRSEESLRKDALSAFSKANPSARRSALLTLLSSSEESVRREVCTMLGAEGEEAAAKLLVKLLRDPSSDVVLAALSGIENAGLLNAYNECSSLLEHPESKIRAKALQVIAAFEGKLPENKVISLLKSDPELEVRLDACKALTGRSINQAMPVLLSVLSSGTEDTSLRIAAARTLEHYSNMTAARGLFNTCAHDQKEASLVQVCRNSLMRMSEEVLQQICGEAFGSEDISMRLAGATIAGMVGNDSTREILIEQLHKEKEPLVVAGLLEEAGRCGASQAWEISLNLLAGDPLVSYAAAQALARLLTPAKLNEFVQLLRNTHELIISEVILERLASYGKARQLPEYTAEAIEPLLRHDYSNIAVLAAEAGSRVENLRLIPSMLKAMHDNSREEVKRALSDGILAAVDRKLHQLLQICPGSHMCEISGVLSRAGEMPDNDPEGVLMMTELSINNVPCSNCCLVMIGILMPQSYSSAMNNANTAQVMPLLKAWRFLPQVIRSSVTPPWKKLLSASDSDVRMLCLKAMSGLDAIPMVGAIADLAFLDHDERVVEQAKKLLLESLESN